MSASLAEAGYLIPKYDVERPPIVSETAMTFIVAIVFLLIVIVCAGMLLFMYFVRSKVELQTEPTVKYDTKAGDVYYEDDSSSTQKANERCIEQGYPERWQRQSTPYDNVDSYHGNACHIGNVTITKDSEFEVEDPSLCGVSKRKLLDSDTQEESSNNSGEFVENNLHSGGLDNLYSKVNDWI